MLMEMPFVKTVVTAPFRWTESEETELAKDYRVSRASGAPRRGNGKPGERVRKLRL